jgi:tRNA 2-thiouridine synthesizing protein E
MPAAQIAGRELDLNHNGHLARFDDWNREVAEALAEHEGLNLTESHWNVIDYLRDYYEKFETSPSPRLVVKDVGHKLTLNAPCTRKTLDALFPDGGCKQACRIAGLPEYYCQAC